MGNGKFIVLEGTDGSGKGTQLELLADKLKSLKIKFKKIDFPRYEENEYGKLIGRYLKGDFGGLNEVNPYLASLPYAGDRMLAGPQINKWLKEGNLVISNRYVLSNKAYMGARFEKDRKQFLNWLDNLEYKVNKIPREDLVIFLYVHPEIGQNNVDLKANRQYLGNKKRDILEEELEYQIKVLDVYLQLAKQNPNWIVLECTVNGQMKTKEEIHREILETLKAKGILA